MPVVQGRSGFAGKSHRVEKAIIGVDKVAVEIKPDRHALMIDRLSQAHEFGFFQAFGGDIDSRKDEFLPTLPPSADRDDAFRPKAMPVMTSKGEREGPGLPGFGGKACILPGHHLFGRGEQGRERLAGQGIAGKAKSGAKSRVCRQQRPVGSNTKGHHR
ncbi:MAG: hypothetical protein O9333_06355 [Beijerinckiaceae bacterium]|nr:hypothetical protein [Beijerinckiaceae bacterium]